MQIEPGGNNDRGVLLVAHGSGRILAHSDGLACVDDRKVGIEPLEDGSDLYLIADEEDVDALQCSVDRPANNFERSVVATHRVDHNRRHSDVRLLR